jgi:hypothetical protein
MPIGGDAPSSVQGGLMGNAAHALLPDEVDPSCLFCIVLATLPFPEAADHSSSASAQCCAFHRPLWRRLQCLGWNADHAHQVRAGKARAQQFSTAHQQAAGFASFAAFSARWRAAQGLAPLSAEAAGKYLTPDQIRGPLGLPLPGEVQATIYRAWCAGVLVGVLAWCDDDPPPEPDGLWAAQAPLPDGEAARKEVDVPQRETTSER